MADMMKHVGVYGEKPCVVVFRELPDEPENALICLSGNLEGNLHDDVMSVVDSAEGQESNEISEVFFRRRLSDGENMLEALHSRKMLQKVPVDMVKLTPFPNQQVDLTEINKQLNNINAGSNPPLKTEVDPLVAESQAAGSVPLIEGGQSVASAEASAETSSEGIAQSMIDQATLMEEDAQALLSEATAKKAQAYEMAPELKPKRGPGRPPKTEA
ncbi:hypothetical protein OAQ62_00940 [bacterium]|jgi:hypothetical protein|nr:hypothetical protein [bacterium]